MHAACQHRRASAPTAENLQFLFESGVRQGYPLSSGPFDYAIDWIIRLPPNHFRGIKPGKGCWVTNGELADELAILGEEPQTAHSSPDRIACGVMAVALGINNEKRSSLQLHETRSLVSASAATVWNRCITSSTRVLICNQAARPEGRLTFA